MRESECQALTHTLVGNNIGFNVRKGEEATKIDDTNYFHFTQTIGFGV